MMARVAVLLVALAASPLLANASPGGSSGAAVQAAPAASQPAPADFQTLAGAAGSARDANRDDEAIALYRQALKLKPEWQEGLWFLGTLLYQKEQYAGARDVLRRFVAEDPAAGAAWAVLGMAEYKTREYARALDHLKRGMALGVGDRKELRESLWYHVAVLLTRFEQFDDAMGLLFDMRAAGQNEALLVEPAGLAALRLPLLPAEIPADRRAMVRAAGVGAFAFADGRRDDADKLLGKVAADYPREPGVHYLYGVLLMDVRPEDGVREMRRELDISPDHLPARLRLVEYYLKERQLDQASALLAETLKIDPASASAHMLAGELLIAQQDLNGGIRELETARQAAPEMVRVRWGLLRAYLAAGRKEDADRERAEIEKLKQATARP